MRTNVFLVAVLLVISVTYLAIYFKSTLEQESKLSSANPSQPVEVHNEDIKQGVYEIDPYVYEQKTYEGSYVPALDVNGDEYWESLMKENLNKYGEIVSMYWPDYLVGPVNEFDVDGDNKTEQIAYMIPPGVNGKGSRADIVKDGKIIFSATEYYAHIKQGESNDSFYLYWISGEQFDRGSVGTKTKFIYKDNSFIPVSEEEVPLKNE